MRPSVLESVHLPPKRMAWIILTMLMIIWVTTITNQKRQDEPWRVRQPGHGTHLSFVEIPRPIAKKTSSTLHIFKNNLSRAVYLLNSTDPFVVVAPYDTPDPRSLKLERVSAQAKRHSCLWASNGGPFHRDGSAAGSLMSGGRVVVDDFGGAAGFGVTAGPSSRWVIGPVMSKDQALGIGLIDYVTGFDWLVYQGKNVAEENRNFSPTIQRAPRTAIGVDMYGNLLMMVADGCELCLKHKGPTLRETADFLVRIGVEYAVNMDGGSSSTLTRQHRVINRPTCLDIVSLTCSRPVASVLCIKRRNK